MDGNSFWLGVMSAAWVFTLGAVIYSHWRYNYGPWKVLRRDIVALNDADQNLAKEIMSIKGEMALRRTLTLTPEDEFRAEMRAKARGAQRDLTS